MSIRRLFGQELKFRVRERQCVARIGHWVYSFYLLNINDIDLDFRELLLYLNTMEDGDEFALRYEKLEQIADDLIVGNEVEL